MRIVSTAWITASFADFDASCCLQTHARMGACSINYPLEVFILHGFNKLPPGYIERLAAGHVVLRDASILASQYIERFFTLQEQLANAQGKLFETLCYIRWLVLEDLMNGESFIHIDLDLFLQIDFCKVTTLFEGKTGTFGSPCFVSVGDQAWLRTYRSALLDLSRDREDLQRRLEYTGNEFRRNISSDQDLISVLQQHNILPRNALDEIRGEYQVFGNPLRPYKVRPALPFVLTERHGIDFIEGKPILFWHLQNNFSDYLSRFAVLLEYKDSWLGGFLPVKLTYPFIQLNPNAENFAFRMLREQSWHVVRKGLAEGRLLKELAPASLFARSWVAEWFLEQRAGRGLFQAAYWWEDGVFA